MTPVDLPRRSLSKTYCLDPQFFEIGKTNVVHREWICIGHVGQLPMKGDCFTADVAGQGVLAVRQSNSGVQTFCNVCQHHDVPLSCRGYDTGPLVVKPVIGNETENALACFQKLCLDRVGIFRRLGE